jgi:alanine racemase
LATSPPAQQPASAPATNSGARRLARLYVSPGAVADNWRFFARLSDAECAPVVKADAYGLGADAIAIALARAGAQTFFVATIGEGRALRDVLGGARRIFVLNGVCAAEDIATMQAAALTPVLNSPEQIALWRGAGPCALHIDTGMNRLGLQPAQIAAADGLQPDLVMSHLANASAPNHPKNAQQRARFTDLAARFPNAKKSLGASAGALLGADYAFDMIRPGIGLYGGGPLDAGNPSFSTAARLTAPLLTVFDIPAGETIGYGGTFTAQKPMRLGTAALGYADGWLRSLSGSGYALVGGARCPLLGRVSMDLVTLDLSAARNARAGDEAEFLGDGVKVDEVAAWAGTIPYEILTNLSGVQKVIV